MENLFWIIAPLSYVLWAIAVIFSAAGDMLQYRYKDSIFSLFKEGSFNHWYFQDPDDTWERKYEPMTRGVREPLVRKKLLGIIIPAFFFDGWHLFKILKQFFTFFTFMACVISGTTWVYYEIYTSQDVILFSWTVIAVSFVAFMMITSGIHELFFKHVFMKKNYSKGE